jgi:hypothetical protein
MKRIGVNICTALLVAAWAHSCMAQDKPSNPWNGSWKAEPSSFYYEAATFSIATDAKGYTVTTNGVAQTPVVCDGKPHTNPAGNDITCVKSATGYTVTTSKDGKPISKNHVSVTGATMTRKIDFTPADSDPYSMSFTSKRISGGPGVAGEWKPSGFSESQDTGVLGIQVSGDSVAFKETDSSTPVTCKLDGTPTKVPTLGGGMAVKAVDAHTLKVFYTGDDGKVRRENTFVLSLDGKMISETDFTPAPGAAAMTLLFHKM